MTICEYLPTTSQRYYRLSVNVSRRMRGKRVVSSDGPYVAEELPSDERSRDMPIEI
jgi:hypothetical protein